MHLYKNRRHTIAGICWCSVAQSRVDVSLLQLFIFCFAIFQSMYETHRNGSYAQHIHTICCRSVFLCFLFFSISLCFSLLLLYHLFCICFVDEKSDEKLSCHSVHHYPQMVFKVAIAFTLLPLRLTIKLYKIRFVKLPFDVNMNSTR